MQERRKHPSGNSRQINQLQQFGQKQENLPKLLVFCLRNKIGRDNSPETQERKQRFNIMV